jgi:hypothetical protein
MFGFNAFTFWRWSDDGPNLREQIAKLEETVQEKTATIVGLEEVIDKQLFITITMIIMIMFMIIIYVCCLLKECHREKKELQATFRRYVSVFEIQSSAMEEEVTNLRKHICFIEGKVKVSGNEEEIRRQNHKLRVEFNGAKFNWERIERALHGKISDMKERISTLEETKRLFEEISKKPVSTFSVQLRNATRSPTVLVELEGIQRSLLVDTGATISLIRSGISRVKIAKTNTTVRGVADHVFPLQGTQFHSGWAARSLNISFMWAFRVEGKRVY